MSNNSIYFLTGQGAKPDEPRLGIDPVEPHPPKDDDAIRKVIKQFFAALCESEKIRLYYFFTAGKTIEVNEGKEVKKSSSNDNGPSSPKKRKTLNAVSGKKT